MMSSEYIRQLADEAAERAKDEGKEPQTFVGLGHDGIRAYVRSIPFLGSYVPDGWKRTDAPAPRAMGCDEGYLFVDKSNWGQADEPALSLTEFVEYIYNHRDYGYAVVEEGQFQVVIACYERSKPTYYECGICGSYHPAKWNGDCRDNANRFGLGELDRKHPDGWEEVLMPETGAAEAVTP